MCTLHSLKEPARPFALPADVQPGVNSNDHDENDNNDHTTTTTTATTTTTTTTTTTAKGVHILLLISKRRHIEHADSWLLLVVIAISSNSF